jgi:flagellar protein FliS
MTEGRVYLKNTIEAMNNDERILFIYFKLIECLKQARDAIKRKNIENRVIKINKSIEIVTTLLSILDIDAGGEIAVRFRSIYTYSIDRLSTANMSNNSEILTEMIRIYTDLHQTWQQKINQDRQQSRQGRGSNLNTGNSHDTQEEPALSNTSSGLELYG